MGITWYGHSCFRIEAKEGSMLIDPFSKEIGLRPPRAGKDKVLLATHNHYDHNNTGAMADGAFLIDGPGEYEKDGIQIEGIVSFHDDQEGKLRGLNTVYVIRAEDMKLCHLGDIGQPELSHEQTESIGDVDILFIPVGAKYTVDGKQAARIISQIDPKIIVPMHYKIPGLKLDIDGPDKFLKEVGIKAEKTGASYRIAAKALPVDETKLVFFSNN